MCVCVCVCVCVRVCVHVRVCVCVCVSGKWWRRWRGFGRFDGSFKEDKTRSPTACMHTIKPTYVPTISVFYTLFSRIYAHIYTYEHTNPPHPLETVAHPSAHCPAVSLCLWTIPTCRVRGPNGPLLFSSRLNINIATIQRLQRISSYNRDTQIKVPRQ